MTRETLLLLALALSGCLRDQEPDGLARTPPGEGPQIRFDLSLSGHPQIPFPNDLLTRPDPSAPTGLRLNLPLRTATAAQRAIQEEMLNFDGFGTFAPITVSFTARLDLARLDGRGRAYADDPILLLDLTEGETFGERAPLDMGRGHYPLSVPDPSGYFDQDPRAGEGNILFETVDEDHNGDGLLDEHEDTDGDGRLDAPNVWPSGGDPEADLLTFYELETDTLILRPLAPLRPGHTYAVVITRQVTDEAGRPVRSPFEFVHHARQTTLTQRLPAALGLHGVGVDEVAFTWLFTTQSATRCLDLLHAGLWGDGPFASLAEDFPADITRVSALRPPPQPARLPGDRLEAALRAFAPDIWSVAEIDALAPTFEAIDYVVSGRFLSPSLRDTADNLFHLDALHAQAEAQSAERAFLCVVPKPSRGAAPFPVALYAHDFSASRLEALRVAGVFAEAGLATCAIDAPGYGLTLSAPRRAVIEAALKQADLEPLLSDWSRLEGEGGGLSDWLLDSFGPNTLQSRDKIRQAVVDWLQFIRLLRQLDGQRRWLPGLPWVEGDLLGDFNGDGVVDLGGPSADLHMTGIGFGGMLATITTAISPDVHRVAPISSGGGFSDLGARADLPGLAELLLLPSFGPLLVGYPNEDGFSTLSFLVSADGEIQHADATARRGLPISTRFPSMIPGERVRLENLSNGEVREARVNPLGGFRVATPADAGDRLRVQIFGAADRLKGEFTAFEVAGALGDHAWAEGDPLIAISAGWGLRRQTPDFRHFIGMSQLLLEGADPINFARRLRGDEGRAAPAPVLLLLTAGDTRVPTSTGLSLARALGLIDLAHDPTLGESPDALLIRYGVAEGLARRAPLVDVDDLSEGLSGADRLSPPLRLTQEDGAALRIAYFAAEGAHGLPILSSINGWDGGLYAARLVAQFLSTGALTPPR
ncbi:Ig-like domain-containing protein [Myxococcota bacterium]|nr:Ig-like domain-containing protein [Myxococcota bacterium]MBU1433010.1 Ig-like domain-containing protein [Myxococcota bacterium]MBU1897598.1 Ig-like domain-containing protein [Myxococcota bacterium]